MIPDPTTEIKTIRHQLGAEMGFDLARIIAEAKRLQQQSGRNYIRLPKREPQTLETDLQSDEKAEPAAHG